VNYDSSYWHEYLLARHNVFLVLGLVLMGLTLIFTLTGKCLVKYQGIVSRTEDPKAFWQNIVVYCVLGIVCLGLYVYTLK
jgi:hypothetical protein